MTEDPISGLIIPDHILEDKRVREVWTSDDIKPLLRIQKKGDERDLDFMARCRKCGQLVQFTEDKFGSPEMVCACKRRVIIP